MKSTDLRIWAIAAAVGAVGLAGCVRHHHHLHPGRPLVVADRLNCPEYQGSLTRVSTAADGNSCEYRRGDGEQVTLVRLPLNGQSPQAALEPMETQLKSLLPQRKAQASSTAQDEGGDKDKDKDKDSARIDVPGVHIDAHGDKAEVRVFGVTVDADNDKANVHAGLGSDRAVVSADENGAEVRANDINATNANMVLILASETPGPTGLHAAGYIARGPVSGPLLVAEFRSTERHQGFNDDHDVRRLMDLNLSR
jgi:hypothetical protein